jgi:single-stranded DNA-specific DHH superfamily exonuclease
MASTTKLMVQLDLFKTKEESTIEAVLKQYDELKKSTEKVRKGLFARHNELSKQYTDLSERFQILEKYICASEDKKFMVM